MNLLDSMKKNSTITNTKGSSYYQTSYNSNLDLFIAISRNNSEEKIIKTFKNAFFEDKNLALANLLFLLDIRNGKGERRIFKIIFKYLALNEQESALKILPYISVLGRYDYILVGIDTPIKKEVIKLIKNQLEKDITSENPSLLSKWLPSHRTHQKNSALAKILMKELNMTEKEYRKTLTKIRKKLNIIETNLTNKTYDKIDFNKVPAKAMLKYNKVFQKRIPKEFNLYKENLINGASKINTSGLLAYEIIKKVMQSDTDIQLCELMWKNQKDILKGVNANILVMADTSGSMLYPNQIPYCTAIGLALYTSERNSGIFKNHFLTFSDKPYLCEIKGKTIKEKLENIPAYIANTDIDLAFELLLNSSLENNLTQNDLPTHIIIISDMEFDEGVYTKHGTNFSGWKVAFEEVGYKLPTIIFWNVADTTYGVPITKFDKDVCMISGFSTSIFEDLLNLKEVTPSSAMIKKLTPYIEMLKSGN